MGGYGSGRPREKTPVEDCRVLPVGLLQRDKKLVGWASGDLTWTTNGEKVASIGYQADCMTTDAWLRLQYTMTQTGEVMDYRVRLTTTPLPWGGVRWAFLCPSVSCGRVCRKLYLPPGGRHFACRMCYRLTYTSAQEAHKFDDLYHRLGITPAKWKKWRDKHPLA